MNQKKRARLMELASQQGAMTDPEYDDELELPRDEDGRVVGYQVGKAFALLDWEHKQEEAEYEALFRRLYSRKASAEARKQDPEAARQRQRDWRAANPELARAQELRAAAKRQAALDRSVKCIECDTAVESPHPKARKFCGTTCRNRYNGKRRKDRNRGVRNMGLKTTLLRVLRREPWLTLDEIDKRAAGCKRHSLASKLSDLRAAGEVVYNGRKIYRRWALVADKDRPGADKPVTIKRKRRRRK